MYTFTYEQTYKYYCRSYDRHRINKALTSRFWCKGKNIRSSYGYDLLLTMVIKVPRSVHKNKYIFPVPKTKSII